jgi:hypothetical protein
MTAAELVQLFATAAVLLAVIFLVQRGIVSAAKGPLPEFRTWRIGLLAVWAAAVAAGLVFLLLRVRMPGLWCLQALLELIFAGVFWYWGLLIREAARG